MLRFIKEHKNGIIGTIAFHGLLILLFFFFGFSTPLPLPAEKGIMINFGNLEDASGGAELEQSIKETPTRTEPQREQQTQPQEQVDKGEQTQPKETTQEGKDVATQDFEEAPAVEKEEKKNEQQQQEQEPQDKPQEQEETQEQQKTESQPEREVNQKALYPGKSKDEAGQSEGETQGEGNQGRESGTPFSDNHAQVDSKGMGGIDFSLEGRNPESLPKPEYNYQVEGKVVVEITVDKYGNVTKAEAGMKGSTTLNDKLLKAARKAALNAKFDPKSDAPAYQKGTITYYFRLQ